MHLVDFGFCLSPAFSRDYCLAATTVGTRAHRHPGHARTSPGSAHVRRAPSVVRSEDSQRFYLEGREAARSELAMKPSNASGEVVQGRRLPTWMSSTWVWIAVGVTLGLLIGTAVVQAFLD